MMPFPLAPVLALGLDGFNVCAGPSQWYKEAA